MLTKEAILKEPIMELKSKFHCMSMSELEAEKDHVFKLKNTFTTKKAAFLDRRKKTAKGQQKPRLKSVFRLLKNEIITRKNHKNDYETLLNVIENEYISRILQKNYYLLPNKRVTKASVKAFWHKCTGTLKSITKEYNSKKYTTYSVKGSYIMFNYSQLVDKAKELDKNFSLGVREISDVLSKDYFTDRGIRFLTRAIRCGTKFKTESVLYFTSKAFENYRNQVLYKTNFKKAIKDLIGKNIFFDEEKYNKHFRNDRFLLAGSSFFLDIPYETFLDVCLSNKKDPLETAESLANCIKTGEIIKGNRVYNTLSFCPRIFRKFLKTIHNNTAKNVAEVLDICSSQPSCLAKWLYDNKVNKTKTLEQSLKYFTINLENIGSSKNKNAVYVDIYNWKHKTNYSKAELKSLIKTDVNIEKRVNALKTALLTIFNLSKSNKYRKLDWDRVLEGNVIEGNRYYKKNSDNALSTVIDWFNEYHNEFLSILQNWSEDTTTFEAYTKIENDLITKEMSRLEQEQPDKKFFRLHDAVWTTV